MPTNPYEPPKAQDEQQRRNWTLTRFLLVAFTAIAFIVLAICLGMIGYVFVDMLDGEFPFND